MKERERERENIPVPLEELLPFRERSFSSFLSDCKRLREEEKERESKEGEVRERSGIETREKRERENK